jgi:hypothetical protein
MTNITKDNFKELFDECVRLEQNQPYMSYNEYFNRFAPPVVKELARMIYKERDEV